MAGETGFSFVCCGKTFYIFFAIIWGILDSLLIPKFFEGTEFFGSPFLILFFALHLFPVWLAILLPIYGAFNYRNIEYAVTDKRVYVSTDQAFPNAYKPRKTQDTKWNIRRNDAYV